MPLCTNFIFLCTYGDVNDEVVVKKHSGSHFRPLAPSKLRLCPANYRPGYLSNLISDGPNTAWAYSEQETENGPRLLHWYLGNANFVLMIYDLIDYIDDLDIAIASWCEPAGVLCYYISFDGMILV